MPVGCASLQPPSSGISPHVIGLQDVDSQGGPGGGGDRRDRKRVKESTWRRWRGGGRRKREGGGRRKREGGGKAERTERQGDEGEKGRRGG